MTSVTQAWTCRTTPARFGYLEQVLATDPKIYNGVVVATIPLIIGAWTHFTFLSTPAAGDPTSRTMFAIGALALMVAVMLVCLTAAHGVLLEVLWLTAIAGIMMAAVAASIGRSGDELSGYGTFIGAVGASLGGLKYLQDRNETRIREARADRLRRYEAVMKDWATFVSNAELVPAIRILEYQTIELERLNATLSLREYKDWKNGVDQILEFLLRMVVAVRAAELDEGQVRDAVGWYFRRVAQNGHLRDYCRNHGFDLIVEFGQSPVPSGAGSSAACSAYGLAAEAQSDKSPPGRRSPKDCVG